LHLAVAAAGDKATCRRCSPVRVRLGEAGRSPNPGRPGGIAWRFRAGGVTEFTETALRHMCRNPRCRSKLGAPVSNPREAFCARGCHTSFYRKRCLVCEGQMERKRENQTICGRRKCKNVLYGNQVNLGRYCSKTAKPESFLLRHLPGLNYQFH
jgi:hypothetical protein